MKIKPLADRVLVKPVKAEAKTASGIIIPEAAQEKTQTATVEAVGPCNCKSWRNYHARQICRYTNQN